MTANDALKAHFKSIKPNERVKLTLEIMRRLEVSAGTVDNWRYSATRIKPIYRREISDIIGKDIFSDVTDL